LFRLFAHEIQLDGQLADLGVEAVALTLGILRDLLDGLDALERFGRDASFELIRCARPFGAACGSLSALRSGSGSCLLLLAFIFLVQVGAFARSRPPRS
jgi:hypothetical protein